MGDRELAEALRAATDAPADPGTWERLMDAYRRVDRVAEGLELLGRLLARTGEVPDLTRRYLRLRRLHGAGIGDPRYQWRRSLDRLALSPDGTVLALAGSTGEVEFRGAADLARLGGYVPPVAAGTSEGHAVHGMRFSRDGAACGVFDAGGGVRVLAVPGGELLHEAVVPASVVLALAPDLDRVAFRQAWAPGGGVAPLRGGGGWVPVTDLDRRLLELDARVAMAAFDPTGTRLLLGRVLHDLDAGAVVGELPAGTPPAISASWSPCGRFLALAGSARGVDVVDAVALAPVARTESYALADRGLSWSRDGAVLAVASREHVHLYESATGRRFRKLPGPPCTLRALALAPDATRVHWLDERGPGSMDAGTGIRRSGRAAGGALRWLGFTPDGSTLLTREDGRVHRWDFLTGEPRGGFDLPGDGPLAPGPRGALAAHTRRDGIEVLDLDAGVVVASRPGPFWGLPGFSPDGRRLAVLAGRDRVAVLDAPSLATLRELDLGALRRVRGASCGFFPAGRALWVVGAGDVWVLDLRGERAPLTRPGGSVAGPGMSVTRAAARGDLLFYEEVRGRSLGVLDASRWVARSSDLDLPAPGARFLLPPGDGLVAARGKVLEHVTARGAEELAHLDHGAPLWTALHPDGRWVAVTQACHVKLVDLEARGSLSGRG